MVLPLINHTPQFAASDDLLLPNSDKQQLLLAQRETLDQAEASFGEAATLFIPNTILSLADTLATSLSFGLIGDDDLEEFLAENGGRFGEVFNQTRGATGAVGDVLGALVPGTLAAKLVRHGGFLANTAEKTLGSGARKFFSTGQSNAQLFETSYQQARMAGAARLGNLNRLPDFAEMKTGALTRSVSDTIIEGVAADAAIALTMHDSDFLFPEEMALADHLAFFAGTNVVIGGVAGLIAKRSFKRGVDNAWREGRAASDTATDKLVRETSASVVGERGAAFGLHAELLNETSTRLNTARAAGDEVAIDAAASEETAVRQRLKDLAVAGFRDSPIDGVTRSHKFSQGPDGTLNAPELNSVLLAVTKDPHVGYGMRSLEPFHPQVRDEFESRLAGKLDSTTKNFQETRAKMADIEIAIEESGKSATAKQTKQLDELKAESEKLRQARDDLEKHVALVVELDGSVSSLATRASIFQDGSRSITRGGNASRVELNETDLTAHANGQVTIGGTGSKLETEFDERFNVVSKNSQRIIDNKEFFRMSHTQKTATFDLLHDRAARATPETFDNIAIPGNAHFLQLDFLTDLVTREGGDQFARKIGNFDSVDSLMFRSLESKFEAFQTLRNDAANALGTGTRHIYEDLENVAKALNLPSDNSALVRLFEKSRVVSDEPVKLSSLVSNLDELRSAMRELDEIPASVEIANTELRGNMTKLSFDNAPATLIRRNTDNKAGLQPADLAQQVAAQRAASIAIMRKAPNTPLIDSLLEVLDANGEAVLLAKKEIVNVIEGNRSQNALTDGFVSQAFRTRDETAFNAFDFITDLSDKAVDNQIAKLLAPEKFGIEGRVSHQKVFNDILAQGNEVDLDLFQVYQNSRANGWDIADFVPTTGKDGQQLYNVQLAANSERNALLWQKLHGEAIPTGETVMMPVREGRQAAVLTERGLAAVHSFDELSGVILNEVNAIRAARGHKPITKQAFHMAAKDLSGQELAFLVDGRGELLQIVSASNERELMQLVKKERAQLGNDVSVIGRDSVGRYYDTWSQAFFTMSDFSRTINQTGPATGKSVGNVIERGPEAFQSLVETTLKQLVDVGRQTRQQIFDAEIQYLKLQKAAATTAGRGASQRTMHDDLVARIAGVQNLDTDTIVGRQLQNIETTYDRLLQRSAEKLGHVLPKSGLREYRAEKRFQKLETELAPEHNPFKSLEDYMASTNDFKMPGSLRKHAAAMNSVTTALTIRMLDVGMAVVNMVSLLPTLPSVVAMTAKRVDETAEQFAARTGAFGTTTAEAQHTFFSPVKAATSGVHFFFSKEGRAVAKRAANKGYFDQFAAEHVELFGQTGEKFIQGMVRKGVDKASFLTDKTETLARSIAFMTMYNLGRKGMGLTDDAAMAFAHRQANNTIADFRPANRPAIFQGAAGMPLGLFTTFMWNYMQRFVSLAETLGAGSGKAGALQVGLQASLFGGESLPGWDLYTSTFMDNYDGSENIVDRLNDAFGSEAADLFLNGSVSNLPRLFGAKDGISIGPRAAVGLPFERGIGTQSIAGLRLMQRAGQTFGKLVDSTIQNQGVDPGHVASILAGSNINKGMSHFIELFGTNESLDHRGNVIEPEVVFGANIETASRLLGFKPLMADELRAENARNRATDRTRNELKARLSDSLRSKIRRGNIESTDMERALESYVRAGGNSENFRRFFQSQVLRGTTSKIDLEIAQAIKDSADTGRLGRLLYLDRD